MDGVLRRQPLMLLLPDSLLEERRVAVRGPLRPLFDGLAGELEPALGRPIHMPPQKALLSRAGGRCETDGANLEFDPFSPHSHRCPNCGRIHSGEKHERAWNTWYHLWLAERAVHAALLSRLAGKSSHRDFARRVLDAYCESYLEYPNVDNVLGPTRPFFSTYVESIWLLNICVAADALSDPQTLEKVRERIVAPSRALISQFDEGDSNRQVWNNAALIASALLLGDKGGAAAVVERASGVDAHLRRALLSDGTWFEGDNYHQFAIRGLWYCYTLCETAGIPLRKDAIAAFDRGIEATFAAALPDFTFPSRKDSQYAVSLRQWRFAELAELGFARTRSAVLGRVLARCYESGHDRRDTGRARSTADAERNTVSSSLTRADLGWRAVLHALPELPRLEAGWPSSIHLTGQGFAAFRRPGDAYVAMDYGQSGAGHGHPDRLNLMLVHGRVRWLDDLGTGSYVDKSLHWYRSTLAHNAPLVDEHSQKPAPGRLLAYDEQKEFGWIEAVFADGDVELTRTLVVADGYFVDELAWKAAHDACIDLPWHVDAIADGVALKPTQLHGAGNLEDGFDFVTGWQVGESTAFTTRATVDGRPWIAMHYASGPAQFIRGVGPGQPSSEKRPFYMVRLRGTAGRLRSVVGWAPDVAAAFEADGVRVTVGSRVDKHTRTATGWLAGQVRLGGRVTQAQAPAPAPVIAERGRNPLTVRRDRAVVLELGEANYRRSEATWAEAGKPRATIGISGEASRFEFLIDVDAPSQRFAPADAVNEYDNEHPDTMGAGVQLYLSRKGWRGMWMLVPDGERVRIRGIPGSIDAGTIVAEWNPAPRGYEMQVVVEGLDATGFNVVINDAVSGRERRRGQLVAGDRDGEFVYLRGDREAPSRDIPIRFE